MTVLIIGLGSMGKRRLRLLKELFGEIEIIGVDGKEERAEEVSRQYGIRVYSDLKDAWREEIRAAFICTSPLSHGALITECLEYGLHVFTELNLISDGYERNMKLAEQKNRVLFLSSTFLYREEIQYIQKQVRQAESMLTYSYHVGQYLPDWHPWESYTDYFIGDKRTNGCREILAIELPWLYRTFGKFKDVQVKKNKKTSLKTTYNDSYVLLVEHENGVQGVLLVDVVSRKAVRNLEIFGEDLYLSWDGSAEGLKQYDMENKCEYQVEVYQRVERQEGYAAFVVENAYKNEMIAFFDVIQNKCKAVYGFGEDLEILHLIDKIEE